MVRPTNEQMFEWADNPPRWQYESLANSEHEAAGLRQFSVAERRSFLIENAQRELARRAGKLVEIEEFRPVTAMELFQRMPAKRTLTFEG